MTNGIGMLLVISLAFWGAMSVIAYISAKFMGDYSYYSGPYQYPRIDSWIVQPRELNLEVFEIKIESNKKCT